MLLSTSLHARPSSRQQDAQALSMTAIFLWPISSTLNQLTFSPLQNWPLQFEALGITEASSLKDA